MRILIIGAGVAGLTLANLLKQKGIEATIVEKQTDFSHAGYSLGLWPLGSRILKGLHLYEAFEKQSVATSEYSVARENGKIIKSYDLKDLFGDWDPMRMVQRKHLLEILASGLNGWKIRMGTSVTSIQNKGEIVEVKFSDGADGEYDLVIGCDGLHSATREMVFGKIPLRETGWAGWAWWVDPSVSPQDQILEYWGKGRFFGVYPAKDVLFCFVGMPMKEFQGEKKNPDPQSIRKYFSHLGGPARKIIDAQERAQDVFFWNFADLKMKTWNKGRVLLLGDACSAILPTAGIGASCAMESAAVLADILGRTDARTVPLAMDLYYQRRFKRVDAMQSESREMAKFMFSSSRSMIGIRDLFIKMYSGKATFKNFQKILYEPA